MTTQTESRSGSHQHDERGERGCCGGHVHAADPKQVEAGCCGGHAHQHEHTRETAGDGGCCGGSRAKPTA